MTVTKRLGVVLVAGVILICGAEMGERLGIPGVHSFIPTAEAIVGRPLSPVSVAGVARRSVRRY